MLIYLTLPHKHSRRGGPLWACQVSLPRNPVGIYHDVGGIFPTRTVRVSNQELPNGASVPGRDSKEAACVKFSVLSPLKTVWNGALSDSSSECLYPWNQGMSDIIKGWISGFCDPKTKCGNYPSLICHLYLCCYVWITNNCLLKKLFLRKKNPMIYDAIIFIPLNDLPYDFDF